CERPPNESRGAIPGELAGLLARAERREDATAARESHSATDGAGGTRPGVRSQESGDRRQETGDERCGGVPVAARGPRAPDGCAVGDAADSEVRGQRSEVRRRQRRGSGPGFRPPLSKYGTIPLASGVARTDPDGTGITVRCSAARLEVLTR